MYLLVLVIRLFAALIGGLVSACARMTVHSAQLVGALAQDAAATRSRRPGQRQPMTWFQRAATLFFVITFAVIVTAVAIR